MGAPNFDDPAAVTGYAPGGTDVAVADGGTGASTAAAARTNLGLVRPSLQTLGQGLVAENYYRGNANGTFSHAAGFIYVMQCSFFAGDVVTNLHFICSTAGTGTTLAKMDLCSQAQGQLGVSANLTALFTAAADLRTAPLTTPYTIPTTGSYYIRLLSVGTSGAQMAGNAGAAINNKQIGSGFFPMAASAGGQTDLPASGLSISASTNVPWCGAS